MGTAKLFPHHRDCGLVRYHREGPLRVDVQKLTVYLGRIVRGE